MPSLEEVTREINLTEEGLEDMLIDPTVYVFGLADVAGEIMRFTTSTIGMLELVERNKQVFRSGCSCKIGKFYARASQLLRFASRKGTYL